MFNLEDGGGCILKLSNSKMDCVVNPNVIIWDFFVIGNQVVSFIFSNFSIVRNFNFVIFYSSFIILSHMVCTMWKQILSNFYKAMCSNFLHFIINNNLKCCYLIEKVLHLCLACLWCCNWCCFVPLFGIAYDIVVGPDIVVDALVFDDIIVLNVAIVVYNIASIVNGIAITFTCFWWGDIQACIFPSHAFVFPCKILLMQLIIYVH